jgi:hypothetical protein
MNENKLILIKTICPRCGEKHEHLINPIELGLKLDRKELKTEINKNNN